jgi:hypothetical protein
MELRESVDTAVEDDWEEMASERQLSFETPACQDMGRGIRIIERSSMELRVWL